MRKTRYREEGDKGLLINKKELLEKISWLSFALSRKDIGKQTNHFIFMNDFIHVYNDEIYVAVPFKMSMFFSVEGDSFLKVVGSFSEDVLKFEFSEGFLMISTESAKAKVLLNKDLFLENQILELFKIEGWKNFPKSVSEGINLCGFSASEDLTRGVLACVAVFPDKIVSTDDIRLSRYLLKDSVVREGGNWLISSGYSHLLEKFKICFFKELGGWLCFKNKDEYRFSIRKTMGEYPQEIEKFFSEKENFIKFRFPKEFKGYLESILPLLSEVLNYDKVLRIKAEGGMLYCIIEKEFLYKERKFVLEEDFLFDFLINPVFLKAILEKETAAYIDEEGHKLYFYSEDFSHILSLCLE